jgi:hypothetical protein
MTKTRTEQLSQERIYQAYLDGYNQAVLETVSYAGKMTGIALQLMQATMANSMMSGLPGLGSVAASGNRAADSSPVPGLMAEATQWQNLLMQNMSDWQQQMLRNAPAFMSGNLNREDARAMRH